MSTVAATPAFPEWIAPKNCPLKVFPKFEQDMIRHSAKATRGEEDLASVIALPTWGAGLGNGLILDLPLGWTATGNLQFNVFTPPMNAKTELWKKIAGPLCRKMEEKEVEFERRIKSELEQELHEKELALDKEGNEEERIILLMRIKELKDFLKYPRRFRVGDITHQTLEFYLKGSGGVIWDTMSEATDHIDENMIFGNDAAYSIYLAGFTGDDNRVDRMNGRSVGSRDTCISALLLANLNIKNRMLDHTELMERGYWRRFLSFVFEAEPEDPLVDDYKGIPQDVSFKHTTKLWEVFEEYRLRTLPDKWGNSQPAHHVTMSQDARDEYLHFCAEMNAHFRKNYPLLRDAWCGYGIQFGHILLVLHAMHFGDKAHSTKMTLTHVQAAEELMRWIAEKQLDLFRVSADCKLRETAEKFREKVNARGGFITQKDLQAYKFCGHTVKEVKKTMVALIRAGHSVAFKHSKSIYYVVRDPSNSNASERAVSQFRRTNEEAQPLPADALEGLEKEAA